MGDVKASKSFDVKKFILKYNTIIIFVALVVVFQLPVIKFSVKDEYCECSQTAGSICISGYWFHAGHYDRWN